MLSPINYKKTENNKELTIIVDVNKVEKKYPIEEEKKKGEEKELARYEYFIKCLQYATFKNKEKETYYTHFLCKRFTQSEMEDDTITTPPKEFASATAKDLILKKAIQEFYREFRLEDYKQYLKTATEEGRENPEIYTAGTVFTPCIWKKYKLYQTPWAKEHSLHVGSILKEQQEQIKELKKDAQVKRQANEKDQMLRMGDGDIKKGKEKYMERMKKQQATKLNKVHDVSISLETDFAKWLVSEEAKYYHSPMTCGAVRKFKTNSYAVRNFKTNNYSHEKKSIHLKVKDRKGLLDALEKLNSNDEAHKLIVHGIVFWNTEKAYANPSTHNYIKGSGFLNFKGGDRLLQDQKIQIMGYSKGGTNHYITSTKSVSVYKLFPSKFSKLENRNKKVCSKMSVLYRINESLSKIIVQKLDPYSSYIVSMDITIAHNGKDTVDPLCIFDSGVISELKRETEDSIKRKEKEKKKYIANKRKEGIRRGKMKSTQKDDLQDIIKLCELFKADMLTEKEFVKMKGKLM